MIVYLDRLRRDFAGKIARTIAGSGITPNKITVIRFFVSVPTSWYFFSRGEYLYNLIGLAIYVPLAILDFVDGDLARITGKSSRFGKWLDDNSDRLIMLVVLGSIFYAGAVSTNGLMWIKLFILFFSVLLLQTVILNDFDILFETKFEQYSEIEEKVLRSPGGINLLDWVLINLLNVQRNSLTRFCFCISYPLFLGLITNQLIPTFGFITFMFVLRTGGIMFIMYKVLQSGRTESVLVKVLRGRIGSSYRGC